MIAKHIVFYVYILECADHTLYTGYTVNVEKRLQKHNAGLGAKYTKGRRPCKLVYQERFSTKHDALVREWEIKQLTRQQKLDLIQQRKEVE